MRFPSVLFERVCFERVLQNAPPDVRDIRGFTSLHLSADRGHRDACAVLIQKANPSSLMSEVPL